MSDREGGPEFLVFFSPPLLSLELGTGRLLFLRFFPLSFWWSCLAIFSFCFFILQARVFFSLLSSPWSASASSTSTALVFFFPVALGFLVIFPTSYYPCPRLRLPLRSNDFLLLLYLFFFYYIHAVLSTAFEKLFFFLLHVYLVSFSFLQHHLIIATTIHTHTRARLVSGMYFYDIMIVRFIKNVFWQYFSPHDDDDDDDENRDFTLHLQPEIQFTPKCCTFITFNCPTYRITSRIAPSFPQRINVFS